ncbi:MAG: PqqD family protein [Ilumatobacteraceae bacterium]
MATNPTQLTGLDITETDDGLVVFQPTTRRVHHLNVTAALVFELCTGGNTEEQIVSLLQQAFALDTAPTAEVASVIASLRSEQLIA